MVTAYLPRPASTDWRFSAEIEPGAGCIAVTADGKKLSAGKDHPGRLDFTTSGEKGNTQIRIWIPARKAGAATVVRKPELFRRGK